MTEKPHFSIHPEIVTRYEQQCMSIYKAFDIIFQELSYMYVFPPTHRYFILKAK